MRPQVSEQQAVELATQLWGLQGPLQAAQLAGYDDRNWRLTGPSAECVLKVHNAGDSGEPLFAEAQNALLNTLAAAGFPVPAPLPLADSAAQAGVAGAASCTRGSDRYTLRVTAANNKQHAVRALTWLPGTVLAEVEQSMALYRQLGALLGRVTRTLQGWEWTASEALRRRFDWNLVQLPATYTRIRPDLVSLPALDLPLLDAAVAHFKSATEGAGPTLRQCLIHSDANERNVLVDAAAAAQAAARERPPDGLPGCGDAPAAGAEASVPVEAAAASAAATAGGSLITGLLDWGDACVQWLAGEPAIAAAYMMLLDHNIGNPLPAAAAVLAGYEAELPLLPAERGMLRTLAMGRLAQSLSLGAHAATQQPDNTEYLLGTQKNGWRLLRLLWGMTDEQFLAALGPGVHGSA